MKPQAFRIVISRRLDGTWEWFLRYEKHHGDLGRSARTYDRRPSAIQSAKAMRRALRDPQTRIEFAAACAPPQKKTPQSKL